MTHYSFDSRLATLYGLDQAVMIYNLQFWIKKNIANEKHYHNGRTWTYNTLEAFTKLFPFWSKKQIRRIIDSLIEKNIIIKGNFNEQKNDRTNWYAFANEDLFVNENTQMSKRANAFAQMGTTICPNGHNDLPKRADHIEDTYLKTNNKTDGVKAAPLQKDFKFDKAYYVSLCKRVENNISVTEDEKNYIIRFEDSLRKKAGIVADSKNTAKIEKIIDEKNLYMKEVLEKLKQAHGINTFNSWFQELRFFKKENKQVIIMVKSKFICDWLKNNFQQSIHNCVTSSFPDTTDFQFLVKKDYQTS